MPEVQNTQCRGEAVMGRGASRRGERGEEPSGEKALADANGWQLSLYKTELGVEADVLFPQFTYN
jgi:hypothetical protein